MWFWGACTDMGCYLPALLTHPDTEHHCFASYLPHLVWPVLPVLLIDPTFESSHFVPCAHVTLYSN